MDSFFKIHSDPVAGTLSTYDRLAFKGHLPQPFPQGRFGMLLAGQGVLLKEFKGYVEGVSERLYTHAMHRAGEAGRPFEYLASATTKRQRESKDDMARRIAERDGITERLVCVSSVLEPCRSFTCAAGAMAAVVMNPARSATCLTPAPVRPPAMLHLVRQGME